MQWHAVTPEVSPLSFVYIALRDSVSAMLSSCVTQYSTCSDVHCLVSIVTKHLGTPLSACKQCLVPLA